MGGCGPAGRSPLQHLEMTGSAHRIRMATLNRVSPCILNENINSGVSLAAARNT